MPIITAAAGTPYYVLLEGSHRIGPEIEPLVSGTGCSVIYGFSDKGSYDRFCANSHLELTPYPLVRAFLRSQADTADGCLKLVVVDAAGPCEPSLQAATVDAVLQAHENRSPQVTAAYRLSFASEANAYRVEEASAR